MTDRQNLNDEWAEYAKLSELYRQTQDLTPPQHLDAGILAAAREAVAPKKPVLLRLRLRRWAVPVSLAATMVLGIGLLLQIESQQAVDPVPMLETLPEIEPMQIVPAGSVQKPMAAPPLRAQTAPRMESALSEELSLTRSPEQWLQEIEELRQQGRNAEAEASLQEFRRQYPDYPINSEP